MAYANSEFRVNDTLVNSKFLLQASPAYNLHSSFIN